jgi:predicted ABC-type ATPase
MSTDAKNDDRANEFQILNHPILVIIRGLPGSGKSYLTAALQKSIGDKKIVALDPDSIDQTRKEYSDFSKILTSEGVDTKFHLYRFSRSKAYDAIRSHKIIIWNQPFINFDGFKKTIDNLQAYAIEHDTHLPLLVVEVETDEDTAKKRIVERKKLGGHGPSEDVFARFVSQYQSFSQKGHDVITVRGHGGITESVGIVKKAIYELQ